MKRATSTSLACLGLAAVDLYRDWVMFGPYVGPDAANAAMERLAFQVQRETLSLGEIEGAREELEPPAVETGRRA